MLKRITKISLLLFIVLFAANSSLFSATALISENGNINGYIKEDEKDETLIGATIVLVGTKRGAYSNKSGFFAINDIPPGKYKLKISMVGYKPITEEISISKNQTLRKEYSLKPMAVLTDEVTVISDKEVENRQISISKVNVPIAQIKQIRVGGESDVFRSLQYLPGVLTSSQISSGLYIRGGSPDQNLILLDGSTVYNPSHLFGFISTFNSDAIKDVELIKGGYPAEYGSRLSAVLNITQKDGNRKNFEGLASLGFISSKLALEGPLGNGSWFISGRKTYFELLKGFLDTDPQSPLPDFGFYDLNGKVSQDISKNDKVFLSGFMSKDDFGYDGNGFNVNLFMGNKSGSLRWTHIFGDNLFSTFNVTGSTYNNGMNQDWSGYKIKVENKISDYTFKTNTEWFLSDIMTVNAGAEVTNYIFEYVSDFSGEDKGSENGTNSGGTMNLLIHDWVYNAYASMNHKISDLISLQMGIRGSYWDASRNFTFDPRVALRYQIQENFAFKASWGIFHQYLRLAGDENFSLFDTWLPTDNSVKPATANHYILSFETKPMEEIDLNFDFYYKDLKNISERKPASLEGTRVSDVFFSGNGKAYGGEIFLQKKVGKLAGWLGYGLGWVSAKFDSINNGAEFRPKYDRRHDFKVVVQYQLNDSWQFGATFMYQSGQSYTGATSRFQTSLPDDNYGYGKVVSSQRYGLRLPNSHQLNMNVNYNTTIWGLPSKFILDVFNVYSRRDILMRTYDVKNEETTVTDIKLLPIIPTISFEIKF
jgi:hypothetical protein